MPGLPRLKAFSKIEDVDGRDEPGHDTSLIPSERNLFYFANDLDGGMCSAKASALSLARG
jgi:hypothetical protein